MSLPWLSPAGRVLSIAFLLAVAIILTPLTGLTQAPQGQTGPEQQGPGEAGGPQGDTGPMAIPRKRETLPPPPPPKPKAEPGMPDYSIRVDVPLVTVPVSVTSKSGQFIPGLKKENFRISEDDVPQQIGSFSMGETSITAVLVVEFASNSYAFMYDALNASYAFANSLKKDDWVAVMTFDMKPQILVDFTQDRRAIFGALNSMRIPLFNEVNVYDALYDALDRVEGIEGRKYIVLVTSGCDTFSKLTYDKVMVKVKESRDTVIFPVSTGKALLMWMEARGYGQQPGIFPCRSQMDFVAADAKLNGFAKATGGRWYAPRFEGELPGIFQSIAAEIRNEYVISYRSSNPKQDGSYRKLKVEVIGPDGKPLVVKDQKGKDVKYNVMAREGYTAKNVVD